MSWKFRYAWRRWKFRLSRSARAWRRGGLVNIYKVFVIVLVLTTMVVGGRRLIGYARPAGEWAAERSQWVWSAVKDFAVHVSENAVLHVDAERGKAILRSNLAAYSTENDTHEPPVILSSPMRSLLYSILGYDLNKPQSFLEAELGGLQDVLRYRQDAVHLPGGAAPGAVGTPGAEAPWQRAQVPLDPSSGLDSSPGLGPSPGFDPTSGLDPFSGFGPSPGPEPSFALDPSTSRDPSSLVSPGAGTGFIGEGPFEEEGPFEDEKPFVGDRLSLEERLAEEGLTDDRLSGEETGLILDSLEESLALRLARVNWGPDPLVLIFHSHTSESYRTEPLDPRADARFHVTNETDTGITRVGAAIATKLQQYGIGVVHSKRIHNFPHHWEAYVNSRRTVEELLDRYPSIQVVLDVHRQGIPDVVWATTVGEHTAAKVEIIYTTASQMRYGDHPHWESNRDFAHRLAEAMEEIHPGLLHRVTAVADKRYNQDLFPQMVLLEVGNYLDWEEHAIQAGTLLADAIAAVLYNQVTAQRVNQRTEIRPELPTLPKPRPLPLSSR